MQPIESSQTKRASTRILLIHAIAIFSAVLLNACSGGSGENGPSSGSSQMKASKEDPKDQKEKDRFGASLLEMGKNKYPDNPNWGYTADEYGKFSYDSIHFQRKEGMKFDMNLYPENDSAFPITLENIDLSVYTPRAVEWIRDDDYLSYLGVINQEWNRQQVRFSPERFQVKGQSELADSITRVDVARNCLNAGLWEVIAYKNEGGVEKPVYHGWFDFPTPLYSEMFRKANDTSYKAYRKPLEQWVEPQYKKVDLSQLREVQKEWELDLENLNDEFYPLKGSRKKKYKNIIRPERPKSIQAMLNDSTLYATFDQPGFYNTENPRETQLGKLAHPKEVTLRRTSTVPVDEARYEVDIRFLHNDGETDTRLLIGGLDLSELPRLEESKMNQGFKMPMGISNHSFYETYEEAKENPVAENPYFGMLIDGEGKWLDSHKVGIDGPLLFWDAKDKNLLHFAILSFERHAFVGHFELEVPEDVLEKAV